ncbi:MAG TPA: restriction endonuclease [Ktedonobacteraceae bacterium]|nr:restriction endonuclease [Ktedonobacteraceae bacterium]
MAIPDFQSFMLPLLKLAEDGEEHTTSEAVEKLADYFGLSEADRDELLPSGKQRKLDNRVSWTKTYLQKAGLLSNPGRSRFGITDEGKKVLRDNPPRIDIKFLNQYHGFAAFHANTRGNGKADGSPPEGIDDKVTQTPQEILETTYQGLRQNLADELLAQIKAKPPRFFETLVVDLVVAMGYGGSRIDAGQAVGQSGDGGIDGIIKEDKLGLDAIYLQAKRWEGVVGSPIVREFTGALMGKRAHKGILITTSTFSKEARNFVNSIGNMNIILIDGEQLAQLMIDHDVGVAEESRYVVKKIDTDYFEDE